MNSDSKITPKTGVTPQPQEGNTDGVRALEDALASINSILAREGEEMSERDLTNLLKQLEAAEGVADDVEGKLDGLLKNLGGMIEGLEAGKGDGQGSNTGGKQP
ncbi:unnamed protein product [Rhizoctonia solani]|uniref:Uncharacterized protein n=1 Tax=Rhizoctonia solani TaxID=456999 RepID=A0A8H2WQR0_9AGAM|nr:unnamed protein product [Rhizoctonia solani]